MKCCMCGFELEYNYCHLVDRGLVFCSIECLKENYDEKYEGTLPGEKPKMTFGDAITKLKEAGFYVIGRITTFKDSYYVKDNPDTAPNF